MQQQVPWRATQTGTQVEGMADMGDMRDAIRALAKADLIAYGLTEEQADAILSRVGTIATDLGWPKQTAGESKTPKQN